MHIEGTLNTTQAALAPLMSALLAIDPSRKLFFYDLALKSVPYASFVAVYVADNGTADATSESYLMPSRLLPREAMEKDPAAYLAAMKKVYGDGVGKLMLGNLVAGGQVARNRGLSMALNPAWRRAVTHMIVMYFFPATTPSDVLEVKRQELQRDFQAFRDLSPGSGAYINEVWLF